MKRREFVGLLGGAKVPPLAQQRGGVGKVI
jgi:hypothetical protein